MRRKIQAGKYLSPVRRIERTAPLSKKRLVAMTFDDGPSSAFPNPPVRGAEEQLGLTEELLYILNSYKAKGTFDVIGTTENNYPDNQGKVGDFTWSGVRFDHYPEFGKDKLAGVKNQLELAQKIIAEGHEIANHGYRHMIFGPMKVVYGKRTHFNTLKEVIEDLSALHQLVNEQLNYKIRLSRPPHYIDKIPGGHTSYDAYHYMNYNYLAASFDGGGWIPSCGEYAQDVKVMTDPIKQALEKNPDALNGQIIFQKDGFNMSLQTPVTTALESGLKMLSDAGYEVVTASELLALSPFEDIGDVDPVFEAVRKLADSGYVIGYKNNTFQPDRPVTRGELAMMTVAPEILLNEYRSLVDMATEGRGIPAPMFKDVPLNHPYRIAIEKAAAAGWLTRVNAERKFRPDDFVTPIEFAEFLGTRAAGSNVEWNPNEFKGIGVPPEKPDILRRRDIIGALAQINLK
ncbi:MAG: S-layer homology domain-containing protein [Bacillota bacterium]|nr:S-layer homology domain-containing protein [Bacillota bacterium]